MPAVADPDLVRVTYPVPRVPAQGVELALELFRLPLVVRIQKRDPFALGLTDTTIPGGADAPVWLRDVLDIRCWERASRPRKMALADNRRRVRQ